MSAWWWLTARLVVVDGMGLGLVNGVGLGLVNCMGLSLEVVEPCRSRPEGGVAVPDLGFFSF